MERLATVDGGMLRSLLAVCLSVLVGASGQLLLKVGMDQVGRIGGAELGRPLDLLVRVLSTPLIVVAIPLYGFGFLLWLVVLSRLQLSFAYPLLALAYLVNPLLSWLLLGENVPVDRWVGIMVICLGVAIVGRSGA